VIRTRLFSAIRLARAPPRSSEHTNSNQKASFFLQTRLFL
jgi:hypothetical protein